MTAAEILALLESDPAAGILATADLIEKRAKAATPGPWLADPTGTVCALIDVAVDDQDGETLRADGPDEVAECYRGEQPGERGNNAEHIASWSPAPALAVAAWLRHEVEIFIPTSPKLMDFCRAYLGGEP